MISPKKYSLHIVKTFKKIVEDEDKAIACALIALRLVHGSNPKIYTVNGTMLSGEDYYDDIRKEIVKRYSKDGIKVISERFVRKGLKNPFQKNDLVFKYAGQNWKNTDLATSSEVIQGKKRYVRYQEKSDFKYM